MAVIVKQKDRIDDLRRLQQAGLICKDGSFFPSVHYPPITMYKPMTEEEMYAGYTMPIDGRFDIYIHIPFCRKHCVFCHYPVKLGEKSDEKDRYLEALRKEFEIFKNKMGSGKIKARSILVGGGTPTYLSLEQQSRFFEYVNEHIDTSECTQYNFDVDPVTLMGEEGKERLRILKRYGVDRLTMGVQSLNEDILKMMNRHHGTSEVYESLENCKEIGFQMNIEFIFGYPGQTLENWIEVIEKAIALEVEEIQLYRLKVESYGDFQGTVKAVQEKALQRFPTLEETILMKQAAIEKLNEHGYYENLRRVFSKKREHFSHYADNQCCGLQDQIGFGLTAFSSLRDRFVLNTPNFDEYYKFIEEGKLPLNRGIIRSAEEQMRWAIVLPLKNRCVWKSYFTQVTGGFSLDEVFREKIENLKSHGLVTEDDEKIKLTDLGAFFADEIVQQFHACEYIPHSRDAYEQGPLYPYSHNTVPSLKNVGVVQGYSCSS